MNNISKLLVLLVSVLFFTTFSVAQFGAVISLLFSLFWFLNTCSRWCWLLRCRLYPCTTRGLICWIFLCVFLFTRLHVVLVLSRCFYICSHFFTYWHSVCWCGALTCRMNQAVCFWWWACGPREGGMIGGEVSKVTVFCCSIVFVTHFPSFLSFSSDKL